MVEAIPEEPDLELSEPTDDVLKTEEQSPEVRTYSREGLLDFDEEQTLARAVQTGHQAALKLEDPELSDGQRRLLDKAITKGKRAEQRLVEANFRLVISVAKFHLNRGMELEDLSQEGNLGLMEAASRFDPSRGFRFATYAFWWIRQSVTHALSKRGSTVYLPVGVSGMISEHNRTSSDLWQSLGREPTLREIASKMGVPIDRLLEVLEAPRNPASLDTPLVGGSSVADFVVSPDPSSIEFAVQSENKKEMLEIVKKALPPNQARVIEMRFGLGDDPAKTIEETMAALHLKRIKLVGLQESALSTLKLHRFRQALAKLRE